MLTFATSSEYNNQGFDILRKRESSNFELIHSINSKGNSHSVKTYSYQDRNLTLGETYIYELVQIDNNGTRTSKGTRAISIINTEIRVSEVFYKSFNHTANIVIDAPNSLWVTIHILEPSGQKVYDQKFRISKTNQTLEIPVKKLSNGLYIFHINYLQSSVVRRIVINH